ncbi:hypothetical protein GUJ93_ZPchr0008g13740 [Zizania palustris]|uniref:Uncharacterized protein n=1 Tax=Zizania palustris TaxID=103762 RepID=A0A8J5VK55_ZIZPA|nr:hypothetical protein GUJ93_ZPchr0008g13740 [Zizania palustris]
MEAASAKSVGEFDGFGGMRSSGDGTSSGRGSSGKAIEAPAAAALLLRCPRRSHSSALLPPQRSVRLALDLRGPSRPPVTAAPPHRSWPPITVVLHPGRQHQHRYSMVPPHRRRLMLPPCISTSTAPHQPCAMPTSLHRVVASHRPAVPQACPSAPCLGSLYSIGSSLLPHDNYPRRVLQQWVWVLSIEFFSTLKP